jgi:integrase
MSDLIIIDEKPRTVALDSVLTKKEWFDMMTATKDSRDQIILCLGVLGLRASEIGACRREWVDLANQTIHLPTGATKRSKGRIVPFGKFRIVKDVIPAFFILEKEVLLTRIAIYQRVKRMAGRAGILHPMTVHGLRATGACWMAQAGWQANALREHFGWSALETAEHYLETSGASAVRAMQEHGEEIL